MPGQFKQPSDVAIAPDGRVYVADTWNQRVVDNGNARLLIGAFPVDGWEQKVFSEPHVAMLPDGTIWVTVPTRQLIRAYDPTGKVLEEIQGGDDPSLPFDRPLGIAYDAHTDTLVITDLHNRLLRLPAK